MTIRKMIEEIKKLIEMEDRSYTPLLHELDDLQDNISRLRELVLIRYGYLPAAQEKK